MTLSYLRFLLEEAIEQLTDPPPLSILGWKSVVGLATEIETTRQKLGISKRILAFGEAAQSGWYHARVWPPHADRGMILALRYPVLEAPDNWAFEENPRCLIAALQQWVRAVQANAVPYLEQPKNNAPDRPPSPTGRGRPRGHSPEKLQLWGEWALLEDEGYEHTAIAKKYSTCRNRTARSTVSHGIEKYRKWVRKNTG